ncbi:hypothetical protein T492DRAFT_209281 [Pavlovales sp. CCMP2436]|nr:hypothetical protein T492DRAFT_209281 [Pavlovales sp. CCMP2436]
MPHTGSEEGRGAEPPPSAPGERLIAPGSAPSDGGASMRSARESVGYTPPAPAMSKPRSKWLDKNVSSGGRVSLEPPQFANYASPGPYEGQHEGQPPYLQVQRSGGSFGGVGGVGGTSHFHPRTSRPGTPSVSAGASGTSGSWARGDDPVKLPHKLVPRMVSKLFMVMARIVAWQPWTVVIASLCLAVAMSMGLLAAQFETEMVRLYVPQRSQMARDRAYLGTEFGILPKPGVFVAHRNDNGNICGKESLAALFALHNATISVRVSVGMEEVDWASICARRFVLRTFSYPSVCLLPAAHCLPTVFCPLSACCCYDR